MAPLNLHRSPVERSPDTSPDEVWYVEDRRPVEGVKGRLPGEPLTIVTGTDRLSPTSWLDQRLAYARTSSRSASLPAPSPRSGFGVFPRSPSGGSRKLVKPPPSPLIGSPIRSRLFGSLSRKFSGSGPASAVHKMTSTASLGSGIPTFSRETWVVESASSVSQIPHACMHESPLMQHRTSPGHLRQHNRRYGHTPPPVILSTAQEGGLRVHPSTSALSNRACRRGSGNHLRSMAQ